MLMKPAKIIALTLVLVGLGLVGRTEAQSTRRGNPRCGHCGRPLVGLSLTTEPLLFMRPWSVKRSSGCACPPAAVAGPAAVDGGAPPGSLVTNPDGTGTGAGTGADGTGADGLPPLPATSGSGATGELGGGSAIAGISMGDLSPFVRISAAQPPIVTPPVPPGPPGGVRPPLSPSLALVRGFKIADNQTPLPVDRYFFTYNFFDYVNRSVTERFDIPIKRIQAYRAMLGFETTVLDKRASIGVRLPINTLTADASYPSTPTTTSLGDLGIYTKYVIWKDDAQKALISGGIAFAIPTGPRTFANSKFITQYHNFELQPYLGYQKVWGKLFLIGFEAINVPTATHDVTVLYNDAALGYQWYRSSDRQQFLQGVSTNLECHANIPLNHRDVFNPQDIAGTADVVDFTYGVNFQLGKSALASFGVVTPVTGPRPFSIEALAILNIFAY